MEKDTVVLSIDDYNKLRDAYESIQENGVLIKQFGYQTDLYIYTKTQTSKEIEKALKEVVRLRDNIGRLVSEKAILEGKLEKSNKPWYKRLF